MQNNRVRHGDNVEVEIYDESGKLLGKTSSDNYDSLTDAIETAFTKLLTTAPNIEDYVYRVTNLTTGTSERYRVNAGGHVRLLE